MSTPRTSISSHRRSTSSSSKHAAGVSTPFPKTSAKFEYPVNLNKPPPSPVGASVLERREFAASLQRALRNIKGPFMFTKSSKPPPSILDRQRTASGFSSRSENSAQAYCLVDIHRNNDDRRRVVTFESHSAPGRY